MSVFVLDKHKKPLMPCTEKRAREMLDSQRAIVHKYFPFTIRLKDRKIEESTIQPQSLKLDPGYNSTGVALVQGNNVQMLGEIHHKKGMVSKLEGRRSLRSARRNRRLRHRHPKFKKENGYTTSRQAGWLPPTLLARVNQQINIVKKITALTPVQSISTENVKFDTQLMQNPDIGGVEYQQGTLQGIEIKEYVLEKFHHTCVYCGKRDRIMEVDHLFPRSCGGSDRISNLVLACHNCNQKKSNMPVEDFIKEKDKLEKIYRQAKAPLHGAAAVNSSRWKLFNLLKDLGYMIECGSGGLTKFNRTQMNLPKEHYYDAVCVGKSTPDEFFGKVCYIQKFFAKGRGNRQICQTDKFGFPAKYRLTKEGQRYKKVHGFQTGDFVYFHHIGRGKFAGKTGIGRVNVKQDGSFYIDEGGHSEDQEEAENETKKKKKKRIFSGSWKYCKKLQYGDGWTYEQEKIENKFRSPLVAYKPPF